VEEPPAQIRERDRAEVHDESGFTGSHPMPPTRRRRMMRCKLVNWRGTVCARVTAE
jgi:hypothetical protein